MNLQQKGKIMNESISLGNDDQEAFLTNFQARVLGCLMEKQMTTPDYYPLTLKALQAACNQKSSRTPVMNLSLGQVGSIVNELRAEGLVTARMDGRADRFEQHLSRKFKLTSKERALICVLMLRGPQTVNEMRIHTGRMVDFDSPQDVLDTINRLHNREMPLAVKLPRVSGQREERYTQLLFGIPAIKPVEKTDTDSSQNSQQASDRIAQLEQQLTRLQAEVSQLWQLTGLEKPDTDEGTD
jgi:uncharacterized protein YceH (UPF0502 family)